MEIIAQTKNGYLIQATKEEVTAILTSVSGVKHTDISINQKIPAIDYASTILKVKSLQDEYIFKSMVSKVEDLYTYTKDLKEVVSKAANLE